jgi:deoxyhypusine synthase
MIAHPTALSNKELSDFIKTTYVFTALSASLDNDGTENAKEKIGEIVIESCIEEFMSNSVENILENQNELDVEEAIKTATQQISSDFDGVVQWAQKNFSSYTKAVQIKVIGAVYRSLMLDGRLSETENLFLNEVLEDIGISMSEIQKHVTGFSKTEKLQNEPNTLSDGTPLNEKETTN